MRIGSLAKSQGRLAALLVAAASTAIIPLAAFGQVRIAEYDQDRSPGNQGPQQAVYHAPSGGNPSGVVPAQYCGQCGDGGEYYGGGDCYGGGCNGGGYGNCGPGCQCPYPGCTPMGAGGTDPPIGYDLMNDAGMAGAPADQRGPHYFDIRAEAVFLQRDKSFEKEIDFTSLNFGNNVVLSTSQLDLEDPRGGFRLIGRYDICPMSVLEMGYTGIYDWSDKATATDPAGNLYSLFSRPAPEAGQFGQSPATVTNPNGPMPFTERATSHSIEMSSDLQTAEISYRRYWLGYHPRVSGTLLAGFRYTKVDENFTFTSQGSEPIPGQTLPLAGAEYKEDCENNLAGLQLGGDVWVSLWQGVRVGSEAKGGVYNNHSRLFNRLHSTPANVQPPSLFENFQDDNVAFIGEGSVDLVADILPSLSFRIGYEVLFLNELVLAGNNFNQSSPYGNQVAPRVPFVDTNGELFYHGGHIGLEYCW